MSTRLACGANANSAFFTFLILLCIGLQPAVAAEQRRRIYFLESLAPTQPAAMRTIAAFEQRLREKTTEQFDVFIDYMDLIRFPSQAHVDSTVRYLSEKYAEAPPDVLIPMGRAAVPFMAKYHDTIAPNVPTIIANVPGKSITEAGQLKNVFWVATQYDFAKTLLLAQQLQPTSREIAIVGGASEYDREWLDDARRDLQPFSGRYTIKYIAGLPHEDMLNKVSQLEKDTIVILSFFFVDGSGQPRVPPEVAARIAEVSPAPVYSPISSYFGGGIVGGHMDSWEAQGVAAADLALEILSGKNPVAISHQYVPTHMDMIDARQVTRWNINMSRVPPNADVRFRESDLWTQYRWQIIATIAILLAQAAAIAWLQLERHRRLAAESELRQRLLEVVHLNRTATAGALSASVAHELSQPLGAIQSNAEAGALYLKADPPNIERVEHILANILRDDQRAAEIISHLRGLLKKADRSELQEIDLNDLVGSTLQIVRPEALRRGVEVDARQPSGSLPVRADQVHLQQVILNLAMNGLDAMEDCAPGKGRLSIQTALTNESTVEVSVADSGIGIPHQKLNQIFDTFFTTKRQGTGLGLSIARTIVETYGGKIWAENRIGGGAVFRFSLPLSTASAT